MDFLDQGYPRSPYESTFNFWNDYLGLSTLVSQNKMRSLKSVTEPLNAPSCLSDSLVLSCAVGHGSDPGRLESCCASQSSPQPSTITFHTPKERCLLTIPFENRIGDAAVMNRASSGGIDFLGMNRRLKETQRFKLEPSICVFCRNNGASVEMYGSHILKTADGRVVCPILRAYTCPLCSANGDDAHTVKYCPISRDQQHSQRALKGGRAVCRRKRTKIF